MDPHYSLMAPQGIQRQHPPQPRRERWLVLHSCDGYSKAANHSQKHKTLLDLSGLNLRITGFQLLGTVHHWASPSTVNISCLPSQSTPTSAEQQMAKKPRLHGKLSTEQSGGSCATWHPSQVAYSEGE